MLGEIGNAREREPVARALRPPLQLALEAGWAAGQRRGCRKAILRILFSESCSAASTGKSGTLCERCRTGTVVPPLLAAGRQGLRSTNDAARVAGPGRICFWKTFLPRIQRRSTRINPNRLIKRRQLCVQDLFSQDFHRITVRFTASSQIHLAFRCLFAYAGREIRAEFNSETWRLLITTSALFPRT